MNTKNPPVGFDGTGSPVRIEQLYSNSKDNVGGTKTVQFPPTDKPDSATYATDSVTTIKETFERPLLYGSE